MKWSEPAGDRQPRAVGRTKLVVHRDLAIGLHKGAALGAGVTGVTFNLYVEGADLLAKTFASAADAQAWSANHVVDLGSLATDPQLDANTLTLKEVLT